MDCFIKPSWRAGRIRMSRRRTHLDNPRSPGQPSAGAAPFRVSQTAQRSHDARALFGNGPGRCGVACRTPRLVPGIHWHLHNGIVQKMMLRTRAFFSGRDEWPCGYARRGEDQVSSGKGESAGRARTERRLGFADSRSVPAAAAQAIFCRRRHQPSRPPLARIRPGTPAPTMGPGTAVIVPSTPNWFIPDVKRARNCLSADQVKTSYC